MNMDDENLHLINVLNDVLDLGLMGVLAGVLAAVEPHLPAAGGPEHPAPQQTQPRHILQ